MNPSSWFPFWLWLQVGFVLGVVLGFALLTWMLARRGRRVAEEMTKKQAEQFGGDPMPDPELDAAMFTWPRDAFDVAPHAQMFLDLSTSSWRFLPGSRLKKSELMAIKGGFDYAKLLRNAANTRPPAPARAADNLSASEALFGFMSWLTTRPGTLEIGARHEAPQFAVLVAMFIEAQGLSDPLEDWPQRMVPMGDRDVRFESKLIRDDRQVGEPIQLASCGTGYYGVQPFSLGESLEEDLDADDLLPVPQLVPADEARGPGFDVPTINRAPEGWPRPFDVPIDDDTELEAVDQELLRKRGGAE